MKDCRLIAIIEDLHILHLISSSRQTMKFESILFRFLCLRVSVGEGREFFSHHFEVNIAF